MAASVAPATAPLESSRHTPKMGSDALHLNHWLPPVPHHNAAVAATTSLTSSANDPKLWTHDPMNAPIRTGRCKFFNSQKGFGFILDDQAEQLNGQEGECAPRERLRRAVSQQARVPSVFVHYSSIMDDGTRGFRSLAEVRPLS